ncbi:Rhodanese-like domain-containing protein [Xylariaceae sp. FL0255]|nr:Rhodanese-like domain-containing protein [Xylariaceae sp. FL0255]
MAQEQPWHAAFPAPKTTEPLSLTREEVLAKLVSGEVGRDVVIVDLRRNDFEGGSIKGAINLPVQSLYPTIPTLYGLFQAAGVKFIIWYCNSCGDRGTRAAGWFQDHIDDKNNEDMKSAILIGGIKGWAAGGSEYVQLMDGYKADYWPQFKS